FIKECIIRQMEAVKSQKEEESLSQFGEVIPGKRIKPMTLPYFDVKVVAGFPIPLNNDELAQDIEVLKMLCPHPDSSYLIRVQG
ncbi:SOS-response transcriptional repressor, partial [gut metagenome]